MKFLSTFGRLPGTWTSLALIVVSGAAEGVGLAMFIPLLHMMSGNALSGIGWPFSQIIAAAGRLGIPVGPLTLMMAIAALVFGSLFLGFWQSRRMSRAKLAVAHDLRREVVDGLLGARWDYSSRQAHGDVLNHLVMECGRAGNALGYELRAVATAILIAIYFAFSILISWHLMAVVAVFGLCIWTVLRPLTRRAQALGNETSEANKKLALCSVDYLRSLKLIKATSTEQVVSNRLQDRNANLYRVGFASETNLIAVYFLIQAIAAALLLATIGTSHFLLGAAPERTLVFLIFMVRTAPRLAQFQQQYQSYALTSPAWRLIREAIADGEREAEPTNPDGMRFGGLVDAISLDHVGYNYPDGEAAAISDLSMTIPRNQMIAVVGRSGAGKSTLLDLIAGLRTPDTGRVSVDGTDLRAFDLASFRRRIGLVSQETVIFNDTLRNNLLFFRPDAPEAVIRNALSVSCLDDLVATLPNGLETLLGEGGSRFSGGQRQRVALARALIVEPDLLLLDEATSALDNESERAIQTALERIAHCMTVVIIAHRLSTVRKVDSIYVMEGGQVVEAGNYEDLLARGGRFAKLHDSQLA